MSACQFPLSYKIATVKNILLVWSIISSKVKGSTKPSTSSFALVNGGSLFSKENFPFYQKKEKGEDYPFSETYVDPIIIF